MHIRYAPLPGASRRELTVCSTDAVPKKRGPKTDVLEALLKRVDGLEKRLVSEGKSDDPAETDPTSTPTQESTSVDRKPTDLANSQSPHDASPARANSTNHASQLMSPIEPRYLESKLNSGPPVHS